MPSFRELLAATKSEIREVDTATADELTPAEIVAGGRRLEAVVREYRPACLAVLGIGAYRTAFGHPKATLGRQPEMLHGTAIWVLPNPSGRNAYYSYSRMVAAFRRLRELTAI